MKYLLLFVLLVSCSSLEKSKNVFTMTSNNMSIFSVDENGNIFLGKGGLKKDAIGGYLHLPACEDIPTKSPSFKKGYVPICYNVKDDLICLFNKSWHCVQTF